MGDMESPEDGFKHARVGPDVSWMVVACDNDEMGASDERRAFDFHREGVAVGPDLEVMSEDFMLLVEVFDEDGFLVDVAVPPLVGHLKEGVRMVSAGFSRFASSGFSVVPLMYSLRVIELPRLESRMVMVFQ